MSHTSVTMRPLVDEAQLRHSAGMLLPLAAWRAMAGAVSKAAAWYRRRRQTARNVAELSALSNHMLKDIGIHRSQIASIARLGRGALYDRP